MVLVNVNFHGSEAGWMEQAIAMAVKNVQSGRGGPFAALIVRNGELIASGVNSVTAMNDPTAHAEVLAIRSACAMLRSFQLTGCELYTSCEPCPMCLGALYWARLDRFFYACTRADAARAGFDDEFIYKELSFPSEERSIPGRELLRSRGQTAFTAWAENLGKTLY